jgi:peptidoglycan DL-endopeptidase CwlO
VRFTAAARPWRASFAAVLAGFLVAVITPVAIAAPTTPVTVDPTVDPEGGSASLREQLDAASRGYLDAKAKLERSQKRQQELSAEVKTVEADVAERDAAVAALAGEAYRVGPLASMSALLGSPSPAALLDRVALLDAVASAEEQQVRTLLQTREDLRQKKAAVDAEVTEQRKQLDAMAQRKAQAERALRQAGAGQATTGPTGSGARTATPAPRNADGSWPRESCSENDPTTSGCLTPRTLHALKQAQAAGFTRYVSCYRSGGSGEHPLGRACDFSAQAGGFGGVATGGDRTYGNNLASYFIRNASRLGVLYVIWFRQIWLPSSGWRSYNGGGDPASDHTNHVHLSVY